MLDVLVDAGVTAKLWLVAIEYAPVAAFGRQYAVSFV